MSTCSTSHSFVAFYLTSRKCAFMKRVALLDSTVSCNLTHTHTTKLKERLDTCTVTHFLFRWILALVVWFSLVWCGLGVGLESWNERAIIGSLRGTRWALAWISRRVWWQISSRKRRPTSRRWRQQCSAVGRSRVKGTPDSSDQVAGTLAIDTTS